MSVFNILFSIKNKNRNNKVRGWEGGGGRGGSSFFFKNANVCKGGVPPLQTCTNKRGAGPQKSVIL